MMRERDRQKEETRRRLYAASVDIFRRDGFAGCRIDDIAEIAGVSRATFYFHFPAKDDVLLELIRDAQKPMAAALAELPEGAALDTVLNTLADRMATYWRSEPRLMVDALTLTLKYQTFAMADAGTESLHALVLKHMTRATERKEIVSALGPEVLTDAFLINLVAAMLAWSTKPNLPLTVMLQSVVQVFFRGAAGNAVKNEATLPFQASMVASPRPTAA